MRDLVIGVTVVLPDGTRASSGGKVVKNVAGYDLAKLFCGSRGRLGAVERLALRLHPLPAAARTIVDGRDDWPALHRSQLVPSAVDIADGPHARALRGVAAGGRRAAARARRRARRSRGTSCARCRRRCRAASAGTARHAPLVRPGPRVAYVEEAREPRVEPARRARRGGDVQPELIADCVHCGFCLPTCPTYSLWHEEMDSPRGRIYLMQGLVDGTIPLTDTVVEHFDRCLGCMACVTAVPVRRAVRPADRADARPRRAQPSARPGERLLRAAIFAVLPHRRRLRAALAVPQAAGARAVRAAEADRAAVGRAGVAARAPARRRPARRARSRAASRASSSAT